MTQAVSQEHNFIYIFEIFLRQEESNHFLTALELKNILAFVWKFAISNKQRFLFLQI